MTPHRTFNDAAARLWNAWDVIPSWGERRHRERRELAAGAGAKHDRRRSERRRQPGIRIALPPRLAKGWIAFECGDERRRVAPIPPGWDQFTEAELRALLDRAESLPPRRRLIE